LRSAESPVGTRRDIESNHPDDEELVSRVLGGESSFFAQIVRRHQDSVYGMARRFLGSRAEAEDAAQEVFLRAYRGLEGFKGRAKLSTWLHRIAFNHCADRLRSRRRLGRQAEALNEQALLADGRSDPEGLALSAEERRSVRRAVNSLQEIYREVVILQYYQGMSSEEISALMGVPRKTVETRLYRARKALRMSLDPPLGSGARRGALQGRRAQGALLGTEEHTCGCVTLGHCELKILF
jgi:RNA polymerase sigma-70 factor (ECF subfamily)